MQEDEEKPCGAGCELELIICSCDCISPVSVHWKRLKVITPQ